EIIGPDRGHYLDLVRLGFKANSKEQYAYEDELRTVMAVRRVAPPAMGTGCPNCGKPITYLNGKAPISCPDCEARIYLPELAPMTPAAQKKLWARDLAAGVGAERALVRSDAAELRAAMKDMGSDIASAIAEGVRTALESIKEGEK